MPVRAKHTINFTSIEDLWHHKRVVFGALVGLIGGLSSTIGYSVGAFMPALQAQFGWSRGQVSLASMCLAISVCVAGPIWGSLSDKMGARLVASASLIIYGAALALLPWGVRDIYTFCGAYLITSCLGVGSTPVTLLKPIVDTFQVNRGLAMGVVLMGFGFSAFWVPRLVTYLIQLGGWQLGYRGLATIAIAAAPVVWLSLPGRKLNAQEFQGDPNSIEGMTLQEAQSTMQYWLLVLIASAMALGLAGVIIHLVPMFIDLGATRTDAAARASLLGFSSIAGRLCIGRALDRLPGAWVAFGVMTIGALGTALLDLFGLSASAVGVLLVGFAFGAEMDILAYFTPRYWGRKSYGALYGRMYAMVAIGSGVSSFAIGSLRDHFGSYGAPLLLSICLTSGAALLTFGLGPYRYDVR